MNWLTLGIAGVSGLGIGAIVVLAIVAPAAFVIVWRMIVASFFKMTETRLGVALIVGVAVWLVASFYQEHVDKIAFSKGETEFKAAQAKRDADIAKDTEAFVRKQIADEFIAQQDSDNEVVTFEKQIDGRNNSSVFRVGDDACRLRKLGGLGCVDYKGVRKAPVVHVPAKRGP